MKGGALEAGELLDEGVQQGLIYHRPAKKDASVVEKGRRYAFLSGPNEGASMLHGHDVQSPGRQSCEARSVRLGDEGAGLEQAEQAPLGLARPR